MITWIGLCAGEIWRYLDTHHGSGKLNDLIKSVDAPRDTIFMALGWLAREGHIIIKNSDPDWVIELSQK